jgi:A/G-specific adenine glycosylase
VKRGGLTPLSVRNFRNIIYQHSHENPRKLAWRMTANPYRILVSEIMLQQTQVERVSGKYKEFIKTFPSFRSLAKSSLRNILEVWQGMGYNRRAVALKKIAETVISAHRGRLPYSEDELIKLPGIGRYTASAILAFAFNKPTVFIETNIRRVFIHFFFQKRELVRDLEILPLVEKTLDRSNPREWYYALMDFGVMLKKKTENPNKRSAHYRKQSPFQGSNRQVRGMILRLLLMKPDITESEIICELKSNPEKIKENLSVLQNEGFVWRKGKRFKVR